MKYKVLHYTDIKNLSDVKERELMMIKGEHIAAGDRLQKAKEALAEMERRKRLGDEHRKAVESKKP